ncbi:hypothetical protein GJA_4193 [Janthinobacterium agaricidamnosum NBRC 102515 = DSM 9628]|uniref:Uncharacterized protein n=1 Tax=Janthinobacterium agaricidamnosum NBRC 102515 = DSM 9628 TaxID=1349767 RepID=W0VBR5_9BURK|nr:hypothetical protein GJA_4193 [Janthinobacterium agaricidamnosum NBRC 102515 = DSM 9628]
MDGFGTLEGDKTTFLLQNHAPFATILQIWAGRAEIAGKARDVR